MTKFSELTAEQVVLRDETGELTVTKSFVEDLEGDVSTIQEDITTIENIINDVPSIIATFSDLVMTTTGAIPVVGNFVYNAGAFTCEFPFGTDITSVDLTSYTIGDLGITIIYKPNVYEAGMVVTAGSNWNLIAPITFLVYAEDRAFFTTFTITATVAQA